MRKGVLLVGEPMGLFMADSVGELEKVESFSLTTCGAELNVAIGLKRLGHNVTYLTKLGNDLFGRRIIDVMRSNGISTDEILYSDTHTTGFMFKSKVTAGDPAICYFRRNSAASTLAAEDVERICYLVGHHHTYDQVDGMDYQILLEADFLVNIYEDGLSREAANRALERVFKTEAGKKLFRILYDGAQSERNR